MTTRSSAASILGAFALGALIFGALLVAAPSPPAAAAADPAAVESFYRGRTVTLIVGYSVGGGYDAMARVLAPHLGRHIPGNPTVVVQNMPGAGSLRAANYLYRAAPKDGALSAYSPAAWRWNR